MSHDKKWVLEMKNVTSSREKIRILLAFQSSCVIQLFGRFRSSRVSCKTCDFIRRPTVEKSYMVTYTESFNKRNLNICCVFE